MTNSVTIDDTMTHDTALRRHASRRSVRMTVADERRRGEERRALPGLRGLLRDLAGIAATPDPAGGSDAS